MPELDVEHSLERVAGNIGVPENPVAPVVVTRDHRSIAQNLSRAPYPLLAIPVSFNDALG